MTDKRTKADLLAVIDDLNTIINSPGYGTGKAAREKADARADRANHIPKPHDMNEMTLSDLGAPIAHFGNDPEDGKDYSITVNAYGSTEECKGAGHDARAFVALWNAYRDGDLVWKDSQ
tara:strand:- start:546 stop:902 length:357 start_codon:yes stop_codon:yes gene_type:complete